MERKAADNKYLHKDFHQSMNILLTFILENYGKDKLIEYLVQYSRAYHKPLHEKLKNGDLNALYIYLTEIYATEEWPVEIIFDREKEEISFSQESCPAISQIKLLGGRPCDFYFETYNTVYKTLCEDTPFTYHLVFFDIETGTCKQIFKRK